MTASSTRTAGGSRVFSARTTAAGANRPLEHQRRDLPERVDPGVRAPRARHRDGLAVELRAGVFEQPLDGHALGLTLPADEAGAVVGDGELEVDIGQAPGFGLWAPGARSLA